MKTLERSGRKIRYAVAGIGHIAQVAILPAFRNAKNSELVALISGDYEKLDVLGDKYNVRRRATYDEFDAVLAEGGVDAVFIALPNHMHAEYTERAARAGVHVLCEKPMAVTESECARMIDACERNDVKLMIAYRLHFEEGNLTAMELARTGKIGEPRYFDSVFSFDVREGDIRLSPVDRGGGPMHDIGIYCINAVRHLFEADPTHVFATAVKSNDPRFRNVPDTVSVMLRFSQDRVANFVVSYRADAVGSFRVVGTKGQIVLDPAYEYAEDIELELISGGESKKTKTYRRRDQFGAELVYFSHCIQNDLEPEPNGYEGLADIRIIEGALESAKSGRIVELGEFPPTKRPSLAQEIHQPPVREPPPLNTEPPHR